MVLSNWWYSELATIRQRVKLHTHACVFHVKVVEVHVVRCYSTKNDPRTLFPVHTRRNKSSFWINVCLKVKTKVEQDSLGITGKLMKWCKQ